MKFGRVQFVQYFRNSFSKFESRFTKKVASQVTNFHPKIFVESAKTEVSVHFRFRSFFFSTSRVFGSSVPNWSRRALCHGAVWARARTHVCAYAQRRTQWRSIAADTYAKEKFLTRSRQKYKIKKFLPLPLREKLLEDFDQGQPMGWRRPPHFLLS